MGRYESTGKTQVLRKQLGRSTTIADVGQDKHILAIAYSVATRKPMVIKSTKPQHRSLLAYEVADASSAAPTYFPTVEVAIPAGSDDDHWLIDGGVVANNPTMCAVSEVRKAWPEESIPEIRVLSVGTGSMTRKINGPRSRRWGSAGWFTQGHILDVLTDESVVSYQAKTILTEGNYIRVNAELRKQQGLDLPPDDSMDDVSGSNIEKLRSLGDFWFDRYGEHAVAMLQGAYDGRSLDSVDPETGRPA